MLELKEIAERKHPSCNKGSGHVAKIGVLMGVRLEQSQVVRTETYTGQPHRN